MRNTRRLFTLTFCVTLVASGGARTQDPIDRIREADLKADLFTLAGDAMRGREGGTLDEMTASMWVAERARQAGLLPAGDNGTYFQFFPLERFRVSASSPVTLGGKTLRMGRDVLPDNTVLANVDAPVVTASADALAGVACRRQGAGRPLRRRRASAAHQPSRERAAGAAHVAPQHSADRRRRRIPRRSSRSSRTSIAISGIAPRCTFPRGTYGLDPDGTAEPRVAAARRAAALRARVGARRPARRRRDARRVDLHGQLSVSVGQHHREGARPRSARSRASTCSTARTRITTASATP